MAASNISFSFAFALSWTRKSEGWTLSDGSGKGCECKACITRITGEKHVMVTQKEGIAYYNFTICCSSDCVKRIINMSQTPCNCCACRRTRVIGPQQDSDASTPQSGRRVRLASITYEGVIFYFPCCSDECIMTVQTWASNASRGYAAPAAPAARPASRGRASGRRGGKA